MKSILWIVLTALALSVSACSSNTSPDSGVTTLQITDTVVGTGTQATAGRLLTLHYTLYLYSTSAADHRGGLVQTSVGGTPFSFTLGVNPVIAGWEQGVPGMRIGGKRTLIVPPSLGYGNQAQTGIPANSTLVFDIELLDVR